MTSATHVEDTRARIRELQDNMLAMSQWAVESGAVGADLESLLEPYRDLLDELYVDNLALAKLADESDLLLHVQGASVSGRLPRVSVLAGLLTQTREHVTRLGKQLAGVTTMHVPKSLDMGVVGVARGSLFVGFSAMSDDEQPGHGDLMREAVQIIADVSALVSQDATLATIAESIPDPAVRDIAVAAVRHLAPSGNIGITEIEVMGRRVQKPVSLTTASRRIARGLMSKPLAEATGRATFIGTVRWLDLDAARFEIRNVEGNETDVRCAYELDDDVVRELMNKRVRVTGTPERMPGHRAVRLLWVNEIEEV